MKLQENIKESQYRLLIIGSKYYNIKIYKQQILKLVRIVEDTLSIKSLYYSSFTLNV